MRTTRPVWQAVPVMFNSGKRPARDQKDPQDLPDGLVDALLRAGDHGLFVLDAQGKVRAPVSAQAARLFRRDRLEDLGFDELLGPLVTSTVLAVARDHLARLQGGGALDPAAPGNPLGAVDVRLAKPTGAFETATYAFEFVPLASAPAPAAWLVRVTDVTAQVQGARELEDLRAQLQTQGEILRGVLQMGGARFGAFLKRADESMKKINKVLKKSAREEDAFRNKLEETLDEVDRVRRDGAAFKLTALEAAARQFEDSLHDLRSRRTLSGGDFLPLAVKLDQLYGQYAVLKMLTASAAPSRAGQSPEDRPLTDNGTQIIEAPRFAAMAPQAQNRPAAPRSAPAGSLAGTLKSLTEHVAAEHRKAVTLDCRGLEQVPPAYQAAVKNTAIQLIRNAVMHGIEPTAARTVAGKAPHGTLRLDFTAAADGGFELSFEDDGCGLDPEQVRATAVARGVISDEVAARLRDREAIKLIFKSGYTTFPIPPGDRSHGTGLALVRRYVHDAGGKIALASVVGQETRFKITLPASIEVAQAG